MCGCGKKSMTAMTSAQAEQMVNGVEVDTSTQPMPEPVPVEAPLT